MVLILLVLLLLLLLVLTHFSMQPIIFLGAYNEQYSTGTPNRHRRRAYWANMLHTEL